MPQSKRSFEVSSEELEQPRYIRTYYDFSDPQAWQEVAAKQKAAAQHWALVAQDWSQAISSLKARKAKVQNFSSQKI